MCSFLHLTSRLIVFRHLRFETSVKQHSNMQVVVMCKSKAEGSTSAPIQRCVPVVPESILHVVGWFSLPHLICIYVVLAYSHLKGIIQR